MNIRFIIFLFLYAFIIDFASAQNWKPVGHGISIDSSKDIEDPIKAFCVYDGKLYIGGAFKDRHRKYLKNIACWNGKIIDTIGTGIDGAVWTLIPYNKYLCMGGRFEKRAKNSKLANGIVLWKDTTDDFISLNNTFKYGNSCAIYSAYVYQRYLYEAGAWYKNIVGIAKWNGISWDSVGGKTPFTNEIGLFGNVASMTEFNGKLYASGVFHVNDLDDTYYVACWDGKKWKGIGKTGISQNLPEAILSSGPMTDAVNTMIVYNGYLYAGGVFDSISGKPIENLARWNDTTWSAVGSFSKGATICAMTIYNNKLYVGGTFDSINGQPIKNIACWDRKSWSAVGSGLEFSPAPNKYFKGRVKALAVYNNELYAGGIFNLSGKAHLNNLAKWSVAYIPVKK